MPNTIAGEAEPQEPWAFGRLEEGLHYCVGEGTENVPPHVRHADALFQGSKLLQSGQYDRYLMLGGAAVVASVTANQAKTATLADRGVRITDWKIGRYRGSDPADQGVNDEEASLLDAVASARIQEGTKNLNRV